MKIGCFGGTFDPPHLGHKAIVEHSCELLDKVIILPNKISPCKNENPIVSYKHRLGMLKLMFSKKNIYIDKFEINSKKPNYTYFTLKYLFKKYNNDVIILILGQDQMEKIDTWYNKDWILDNVDILCYSRKREYLNNKYNVNYIDLDINISSTIIREKIKAGISVSQYLYNDVNRYIKEKNIYK